MRISDWLVKTLTEEDNPPSARYLIEASIHLSTRGKTFNASYRDASGRQVWRTTRLRDPEQALKLAQAWEAAEQQKRAAQRHPSGKEKEPASPGRLTSGCGFSEAEVAAILHVSQRTVRQDLKRAFAKLRQNPALRELWREWTGGEVEEALQAVSTHGNLSPREIALVLSAARTPLEWRALRKLLALARIA
jgi:hypothetical protein